MIDEERDIPLFSSRYPLNKVFTSAMTPLGTYKATHEQGSGSRQFSAGVLEPRDPRCLLAALGNGSTSTTLEQMPKTAADDKTSTQVTSESSPFMGGRNPKGVTSVLPAFEREED
ncbi:hypothetical protein EVAR_18266_1 [Eumeta japonica]|uniref:Uncharacterized protein n=1 Tax=Eumeta variegata TaxID=151549 RepID=A0A4C1UJX7_EUMVA|nr:hypothetical protein EVAR_18266_1 [Eumeta japonica]